MDNVVGVVRGSDKLAAFDRLVATAGFDAALLAAHEASNKDKADFRVVIKPNMMVFVNQKGWRAIVTDAELVERLVDHVIDLGFTNIALCEARTDVSAMMKNRTVAFVADKIGYRPAGRYRIADLTLEEVPFAYEYLTPEGGRKTWKDGVGRTWMEADFRITFAKAKSHEHDWLTLGIKNVYGCFPSPKKIRTYHIRDEVFDVTARSIRNFPVHFSFVDAWVASDGFQGYKIAHPKELHMLFGGRDLVAVDMEMFKRAGFATCPSLCVKRTIEQAYGGTAPIYTVAGDTDTIFADLAPWENIPDETVKLIDRAEEVYVAWGFINLKAGSEHVDFDMFPPKNLFYRMLVWLMRVTYRIVAHFGLFERFFGRA